MTEQEVIIVDGIPSIVFDQCFYSALQYALVSCPFTYNRLNIRNPINRIENITKGKLAERLFEYFCKENALHFDFESCTTDYSRADKRDFLHNATEFDIKNNFLNHIGSHWFGKYTTLPALVPDNSDYSQWRKRNKHYHSSSKDVAYVFSFMKLKSVYKGQFFNINLSSNQISILRAFYPKAKTTKGFDTLLLNELGQIDFSIRKHPDLVITGVATKSEYKHFTATKTGIQKYNNGVLRTKIKNQKCTVKELPSFYKYFGMKQINCGRLKQK